MKIIQSLDKIVTTFMSDIFKNPVFDFLMPYLTLLAEYGILFIICTLFFIAYKPTRKLGTTCAISMVLDFVSCNLILKNIVIRTRPDQSFWNENILIPPHDWSFPSGHSAVSFAFAVAIFCHNKKWGTVALICAVLISFSRIYLCVHWFSDVLGGMILGTACALLANLIVKSIYKKYNLS